MYLRAVQSAAVDRALSTAVDAREYLALVGALETPVEDGDRAPLPGVDAAHLRRTPDDASALLGAALASVASTAALSAADDTPARTDGPWVPAELVDDPADTDAFVLEGAVVACRRFDASIDQIAATASVSEAELRSELASRAE
jgi:hypothetical protein